MVAACLLAGLVAGCAGGQGKPTPRPRSEGYGRGYDQEAVRAAEEGAGAGGRKVLETGRRMAMEERLIIPGACWDYANAIYERAGFGMSARETVFKSPKKGPYAKASQVRAGDFVSIINNASNGIEHSAIFVYWEDRTEMRGVLLTYAGNKRQVPARYLAYDLSSIYRIVRPKGD